MLGAHVAAPTKVTFNGLRVDLWPRVTWSPLFALTFDDLKVSWCCADPSILSLDAYLAANLCLVAK